MRVAFGSMMHESNTFNKLTTGLETFNLADGDEFRAVGAWKGSVTDGIYDTLTAAGAEVAPLFFARAIPSGAVRRDAYEYIKSRMIDKLRHCGKLDGICLALHGSMAVDGLYDPEGDLLEAIRWEAGHEIPIVCSLDMHATITERMITLSNGFAAYRTAPHIDTAETGARAASMLLKALKEHRIPINTFTKIPLLISGEQSDTRVEPANSLFAALDGYDTRKSVLCASYTMGFPWADSPFGGAGALVTGWAEDKEYLKELSEEMAGVFWQKRSDFVYSAEAYAPEQALKAAAKYPDKPAIISDTADNPTAGASQDNTRFIRLMLENNVQNAVYKCVADPAAYRRCAEAKQGDEFSLTFGGCYSGKEHERLTITASLLNLAELHGTSYAVVKTGGVTIIISDKRCATANPDTLRHLGLTPESFDLIVIKAGYLSAEYQAIGKYNIFALTEGDTALELRTLPYVKTPRPMYPLDMDMKLSFK